jgi:hypothetical protein
MNPPQQSRLDNMMKLHKKNSSHDSELNNKNKMHKQQRMTAPVVPLR